MASILIEETKDIESVAIDGYGSVDSIKKKRRRRVSFAKTQTVHFIPRKEDIDTPPLDSGNASQRPSSSTPSAEALSESVHGLASYFKDDTADLSHFTCDMDTGHGSWADDDTSIRRNSLDGADEDSGCFVRLENLLDQGDDDSIVNDVLDDDVTVDATTFTKNLSQILKSGTTFDSGSWVLSNVEQSNGTPSADDSMALTRQAPPHWNLVPKNVSVLPDEGESDMSLESGMRNFKWKEEINTLHDRIFSRASSGVDANRDSEGSMSFTNAMDISLHQVVSNGSKSRLHIDENSCPFPESSQNCSDLMQDSTFSTADFNSTVPVCNLKDLLSDHTDYTIMKGNTAKMSMMDDESHSLSMDISKSFSKLKRTEDFSKCSRTTMNIIKEQNLDRYHEATESKEARGVLADISNKESTQNRLTVPGEKLLTTPKHDENLSDLKAGSKADVSGEIVNFGSHVKKDLSLDFENGGSIQGRSKDRIVKRNEDPKVNGDSKSDLSGEIMKLSSSKATGSAWKIGNISLISRRPQSSVSITLDGMLQQLQDEYCSGLFQNGDKVMPLLSTPRLQTLSDYLQFSCTVLPQLDWLSKHVHELTEKIKYLKENNLKMRDSKHLVQKLTVDSSGMLKFKFEKKLCIAKKEWIVWKIDPERQNLESLQEKKDDLINEVAAAQGTARQILQLKETYLQTFPDMKSHQSKPIMVQGPFTPSISSKNTKRREENGSVALQKCHLHHEDACRRLTVVEAKREQIEGKINSILSLYNEKFRKNDTSFAGKLKASLDKLTVINSLLQQQQVMKVNLRGNGGRSESQFSIERMYSQILQYEGDGPLARVNIDRLLRQEEIDMMFPCMDAFLAFQYLVRDLQSVRTVQVQHVHQLIQQTGRLFGCLMDFLKEIKYCQRSLSLSCKFQIPNDKLLLTQKMLRCASGMKISLVFDMSFIRDGKYRYDLLPTEVLVQTYGCPNANITSKEISAKIARVEPGFARLYRICSCVDELLQEVQESA